LAEGSPGTRAFDGSLWDLYSPCSFVLFYVVVWPFFLVYPGDFGGKVVSMAFWIYRLWSAIDFSTSLVDVSYLPGFFSGYICFLLWSIRSKVKKCDGKLAEKSDEFKELVQDLIESASELFKKENINPAKYPLRLKFNDYPELEYVREEKDLEKYIAYLEV